MKRLFVLLLILCCAWGSMYAQSRADYEYRVNKFRDYLNEQSIQKLCVLFQPKSDGQCVWNDYYLQWILNCFGTITKNEFVGFEKEDAREGDRGWALFKLVCSKRTVYLACLLDEFNKFVYFEFNIKSDRYRNFPKLFPGIPLQDLKD